ncbi:MAG: thioredoxin [Clostridiales bacterium]|nr:thioredoxin [Clostridiales bacterium]
MKKKKGFGLVVIVAAVAMIAFGIFREETTDVFNKAIRICLECIGIGWLQ